MSLIEILAGINYGLVLFFGFFLSVSIAGGCKDRREQFLLAALSLVFLVLQTVSIQMIGMDATKHLYPLLVHLPLLLMLTLVLKRPVGVSLVSIAAAYLCCQLPRCGEVIAAVVTGSGMAGQIVYCLIIAPIFLFLWRYFVPSARDTVAESPSAMWFFGSFPILYYFYDYTVAADFTLLYSELARPDFVYSGGVVIAELVPTVVGLLYMVYTTAYRRQLRRQTEAEMLSSQMAAQLRQAEAEMFSLRRAETQAAAYQHDMRHHLAAIDGLLAADNLQQAREYIQEVRDDIQDITPKRFCENELVNLLCSSFWAKAERMEVRLKVEASLPGRLTISDTELCALLSNGLENALNAAGTQPESCRWVEFFCNLRLDKLLIEIRNPYSGQVPFRDGLPVAGQPGHGYGCRSIHAIAQNHRGLCDFSAEGEVFTLRVVIPL